MLHFLWWWALDNAPDGNISGISEKVLATASHWRGDPTLWMQTLREVGLVDDDTGVRVLHNWNDYAGKLIAERTRNRERQREFRERHRNANVTVTSPLRNGATVPNPTVPNHYKEIDKEKVLPKKEKLPDWINKKTWDSFIEMRKGNRASPTGRAVELILKELEKLKAQGNDPNEVLEQSIMNNYKGVFPLKDGSNGRKKYQGDSRRDVRVRGLPESYTDPASL